MYVIGYYITIAILFYLLHNYLQFIKTDYTSILQSGLGQAYWYSGHGRVALTYVCTIGMVICIIQHSQSDYSTYSYRDRLIYCTNHLKAIYNVYNKGVRFPWLGESQRMHRSFSLVINKLLYNYINSLMYGKFKKGNR